MLFANAWDARRRWALRCLAALAAACGCGVAAGQSPYSVVAVEEDWQLVVGEPDPDSDAPQIICVISPHADGDGLHAAFELNQRSVPGPAAGGMQLHVWDGELATNHVNGPSGNVLSQSSEAITWTLRMRLESDQIQFEVVNGDSSTWGRFGGNGQLSLSAPTELKSLDGYRVATSVENSGAGYAANRVQSLVLKAVRYRLASGQVLADQNARVISLGN